MWLATGSSLVLCSGCASIMGHRPNTEARKPYPGVRIDAQQIADPSSVRGVPPGGVAFWSIVDFPFSAVLDTLLLPIDLIALTCRSPENLDDDRGAREQRGERFSLSAKLLQPQNTNASLRVAIELRNASGQPQRIVTLTNLFEGNVYLRDVTGDVHEFTQSNYWNMLMTSLWQTPTVELAPGNSYRWEHSLSEFIDSRRRRSKIVGGFGSRRLEEGHAILSAEFQPACEMWYVLDIHQWKKLDGNQTMQERTAIAVSNTLRFPK